VRCGAVADELYALLPASPCRLSPECCMSWHRSPGSRVHDPLAGSPGCLPTRGEDGIWQVRVVVREQLAEHFDPVGRAVDLVARFGRSRCAYSSSTAVGRRYGQQRTSSGSTRCTPTASTSNTENASKHASADSGSGWSVSLIASSRSDTLAPDPT
jgi:hypothetical protein